MTVSIFVTGKDIGLLVPDSCHVELRYEMVTSSKTIRMTLVSAIFLHSDSYFGLLDFAG